MKKLIYVAALLVTSLSAYAQGTINFNNRIVGTVVSPVFDVGGTVGLSGAAFFAQLYAGPAGTTDSALGAIGAPVTFRTGAGAGFINAPLEAVTVPGVAVGATARVQMRAWDSTYPTYAAAVAAGNAKLGSSTAFDVTNLGGPGNPPATPANLTGLTSFSLTQVPEPSTIALGALGIAALLFRRRK